MKLTLEEIETVLAQLQSAMDYTKEAKREAKKVYGNDNVVSAQLKHAYAELQRAITILEMQK